MDTKENKSYPDWDSLQITLVKDEEAKATIRMMRQDIEAMMTLHGISQQDVIETMIAALEEEWKVKNENDKLT